MTPARDLDGASHGFAFVRSEIVEHDDGAGLEGRDQELFNVGEKALAVDRAVGNPPVAAACTGWSGR